MNDFYKGQKVNTPLGQGTVAYQRLDLDGRTPYVVSVVLDSKKDIYSYTGTILKAEDVKPVE